MKPDLIDLALKSHHTLVLGLGGGGDVIQGIPIAHLLRKLGVAKITMGGVTCQWWTPDGNPLSAEWGVSVMGPTIYRTADLTSAETIVPGIAKVSSATRWKNCTPCEARLADTLPADQVVVVDIADGAGGMATALQRLIAEQGVDLIIGVDIGSDSFHDGQEAVPAKTSLIDFLSLGALITVSCPTVYAVAGYGCDGEMMLPELDARVSRVMKAGGYLGAQGLTQADVAAMKAAIELYPDPVEPMSVAAAEGDFGFHNVWTHGPWGTVVTVTPLGAVMLCFDPAVLAEANSRGILALQNTKSLAEAETIYRDQLGQFPETRLAPTLRFFS